MKFSLARVVIITCVIGLLSSCAKINLSGSKGSPGSTGAQPQVQGGPSLLGMGQQQPAGGNAQTPPTLDGVWEVDYEFKGQQFMGNVEFAQQNNQVAGQGTDQNGLEYQLDGSVDGTKVTLVKKYVNADPPRPPVTYKGELKYLQGADYTGWAMEGEYSAQTPNGATISGKWVGNPLGPPADAAAQAPQAGAPEQAAPQIPAASPLNKASSPAQAIGDARPSDISGRYAVGFQYKFKKNNSKMWLKQDADKLSGDGQDTTTGEKFTLHGWYIYPKVTIVRTYKKAAGAKADRQMTFKAKLSSDGNRIQMNGETEFGGQWDAHLVR